MLKRETLKVLVENFGMKYSEVLGIRLETGREGEIFKWFLAAVLFGAPIRENSAIKTYRCFQKHRVLTPERILKTGWDGLVRILDEGGYTRYDFKTAYKLLEVTQNLMETYDGKLTLVHEKASDPADLEAKLKSLGKGVGDVTVNIFLRELRSVWVKAKPNPTGIVVLAAKNLEIIREENAEKVLHQLEKFWEQNGVADKSFINFESALIRLGKDFCRKRKCPLCPVKEQCVCIRHV